MNRILRWIRGESQQKDEIKTFFEETVDECYVECIKTPKGELSKPEKACLERCTKRKLELVRNIEIALEEKLKKG